MKYYHYLEQAGDVVVRVMASRKPSAKTMPRSGSWVVNERIGSMWRMPAFPEAGWHTLSQLEYLGCTEVEKK